MLAPNPDWHREQAATAETSQQWFAVRFHLRKLSDLRPDDADAKRRLQAVEDKLKPREVAPLPRGKP